MFVFSLAHRMYGISHTWPINLRVWCQEIPPLLYCPFRPSITSVSACCCCCLLKASVGETIQWWVFRSPPLTPEFRAGALNMEANRIWKPTTVGRSDSGPAALPLPALITRSGTHAGAHRRQMCVCVCEDWRCQFFDFLYPPPLISWCPPSEETILVYSALENHDKTLELQEPLFKNDTMHHLSVV